MAFDPSLPANSTKLRLAPGVIQNNWAAIEEGLSSFKPQSINLDNRTPLAVSNDPTAIPDTYITYCKDDASGNPELFGINESSQISQLTAGVPTVTALGNTFLPGGLILSWGGGSFSNNQTISPSGISTLYQVVISINDSSATPASRAYVFNINTVAGTFQVKLPSGTTSLTYIAIGI